MLLFYHSSYNRVVSDEQKTNNAAEEKADVAAWKMNKIMFKGIV